MSSLLVVWGYDSPFCCSQWERQDSAFYYYTCYLIVIYIQLAANLIAQPSSTLIRSLGTSLSRVFLVRPYNSSNWLIAVVMTKLESRNWRKAGFGEKWMSRSDGEGFRYRAAVPHGAVTATFPLERKAAVRELDGRLTTVPSRIAGKVAPQKALLQTF